MSAVVRRLRPATTARMAVRYVRAMTYRSLVVAVAVIGSASVLLSLVTQNDVSSVTGGEALPPAEVPLGGVDDGGRSSSTARPDQDRDRPLFSERPLTLLALSYHAAPIYDLMDHLQPLGVRFVERGINAYACKYFNTCRQDGLLEARSYAFILHTS